MLKVLLYGLATFMETGIGVWIFGQMFPKRSMEDYRKNPIWMYHYLWKDRKDPCIKTGSEKYLAAGSWRCGRT